MKKSLNMKVKYWKSLDMREKYQIKFGYERKILEKVWIWEKNGVGNG